MQFHSDPAVLAAVTRRQRRERELRQRARPLADRVAEAMRDIAAAQGSCDRDDLVLRFPAEEITDQVIAEARRRAGRLARVA